ncbi:MAG: hypothetical protein HYU28_12335 [Actinobacteria bacterium]|nr:hypothetical protein [Actinomycetota bacterium]
MPETGNERERGTPLEELGVLAVQEKQILPGLEHVEVYTWKGLLTLLWHGPRDAEQVLVAGGGAAGGLLGPANGLYHDLGTALAEQGIGTIRVSWRRPDDIPMCSHDMAAACEMAAMRGARAFVSMGHSFGGAIAVRVGVAFPGLVRGVVTLATQSAGCENAAGLDGRPLLLFHGDRDELLPPHVSEMVNTLAGGHGELVILPGTGHLMTEAADLLRERLLEWVPRVLAAPVASPE